MSIISLFLHASLVVQLIMLILLAASILSWVLIFQRGMSLKRARKAHEAFEERFWSGVDLNELYREVPSDNPEGAAHVFRSGFREFNRLLPKTRDNQAVLEGVQRSMRVALSREEEQLDQHLPILATISSSAVYIGLFGTVWGIMGTFQTLGNVQQVTLGVIAPSIAEALVATAMGLFAAIPAVIAYNRLTSNAEKQLVRMENFAEEFHSILHRNLQSRSQNDAA
ncbi:protein TolQ [Phytohalomonas tamaricis]|uniref:protein TolQ n=1 Tax=Phytohalomonas tamaricis TaxID=2081032 RepID=UPI00374E0B60